MRVGSRVVQSHHHHGPPWVVLGESASLVYVARRLDDGTVDVAGFSRSTISELPVKCGTCSRLLHCQACGAPQ